MKTQMKEEIIIFIVFYISISSAQFLLENIDFNENFPNTKHVIFNSTGAEIVEKEIFHKTKAKWNLKSTYTKGNIDCKTDFYNAFCQDPSFWPSHISCTFYQKTMGDVNKIIYDCESESDTIPSDSISIYCETKNITDIGKECKAYFEPDFVLDVFATVMLIFFISSLLFLLLLIIISSRLRNILKKNYNSFREFAIHLSKIDIAKISKE